MEYIRQLTGSAKTKANSSRGGSPISDIVESADEARANIDAAIQGILDAAETMRDADVDVTMDSKDTEVREGVDSNPAFVPERVESTQTQTSAAVQSGMTEEQAAQTLRDLYHAMDSGEAPTQTHDVAMGNGEAMDEPMPLTHQEPDNIKPTQPKPTETPTIAINMRDANGYSTIFRVKPNTKLLKMFKVFAKRYETNLAKIRFISSDGRLLPKNKPNLTIESEGFEDGDEIDVMLEQIGGWHIARI